MTTRTSVTIHHLLGAILIILGILLYLTPIPGTTLLILIGFVWLLGGHRATHFFKRVLGKKAFKSMKVESVIKKI
jgi:uncharacterized membrane protein HdeD (DUF308 family)